MFQILIPTAYMFNELHLFSLIRSSPSPFPCIPPFLVITGSSHPEQETSRCFHDARFHTVR